MGMNTSHPWLPQGCSSSPPNRSFFTTWATEEIILEAEGRTSKLKSSN